jgi:ribose transport system substrate-binding protein
VLRTDGTSVIGHLGEKLLRDLHIGTAFVSCSGFSLETGLTESDIQEIQLKSKMVQSADHVIALVDSSKLGKMGLSSFASLDQIHQIFTNAGADPGMIQQICAAGVSVSVCGDTTVSSFASTCSEISRYKIGFANLGEDQIPFAVDVRRGLEQAAKKAGNIDLILADNRLDKEIALKVADDLIAAKVDLAIEYQIDERTGNTIFSKFKNVGIPVISVDIPMVGATFFGVDNYQAGYLAGSALGRWIQQEWEGRYDRVIVLEEQRAGALPAARIHGQLDGLGGIVGEVPAAKLIHLESGNTNEESEFQMTKTLLDLPGKHRLAVICFNDDAAVGALAAASKLNREHDVVIVGQGADRRVRNELRRPGSRIIGSTAYWPERYGEKLIDSALRILKGEPVSPAVYIDHTLITPENIDQFYPEEQKP